MNRTTIEWCRTYRPDGSYEQGFTTNPVRFLPTTDSYLPTKPATVTMCQKVSPGCAHCYAESIVRRFWPKAAGKFPGYTAQGVASGQFVQSVAELEAILRHRKPCRLFWGDMTDLFQDAITDEFLDRCFAVCALTPHITHIFLTKRPERMLRYIGDMQSRWVLRLSHAINTSPQMVKAADAPARPMPAWPLRNVWLGVSVEDQKAADERIPLLLQTPAAVRFISAEPLLGSVMLPRNVFLPHLVHGDWPIGHNLFIKGERIAFSNPHGALAVRAQGGKMLGIKPGEFEDRGIGLDWVICGGESGTGARPMHPDWARSLRDQCQSGRVPFFFKQWGEWAPLRSARPRYFDVVHHDGRRGAGLDGATTPEQEPKTAAFMEELGKKAAGAMLDGREWREFPEARCIAS